MENLFVRFDENPLLTPQSIASSAEGLKIECLLNPGVFQFDGKIGLLLRVAERPIQKDGTISFPIADPDNGIRIIEIDKDDKDLDCSDARVINYKGEDYLTTMSHLRPVFSEDGVHFKTLPEYNAIFGSGMYESYGIEDCRVTQIGDEYLLTFSSISSNGVGVGMKSTKDWKTFKDFGLIFPPHNKDCAVFSEKINGKYFAFHRPSSPEIGGNYVWIAESTDLEHWGKHQCIAQTRDGMFDSKRLGAGCAPIKTEKGWLAIYHGATAQNRYCLGALLLDLTNPSVVIARSESPIMEPIAPYERTGFFGDVIFTNGHVVNGDELTIYYGAADEVICAAKTSIKAILETLHL